jgi:hypothetical protein
MVNHFNDGWLSLILRSRNAISAGRDKRFRQYDCPKE